MTMTWPEGAVMGLPRDPTAPQASAVADAGFSGAGTLLALATAYQLAQYRLSRRTEAAARALWLQYGGVSDAAMREWMGRWDGLLAGQAREQGALTQAYLASAMGRFGVRLPAPGSVYGDVPTTARDWLASEQASIAPPALRSSIEDAVAALDAGRASIAQAALADRAVFLHSPVVKERWATSQGAAETVARQQAAGSVESATYAAGRAVERLAMGAQSWPSFQNGVAMLYRRVTHPGACGWCVLVSTRLYSLASFKATGGGSSARWHVACRCTWAPITFEEASTYANHLRTTNGDYYAAARAIGLWQGDAPANWRDIERQRATGGTGTAPAVRPVKPDPQAQARAQEAAARETQAVELVNRANDLNARARALFASGDPAGAKRLYEEAITLTSQALRLRTGK